MFMPRLRYPGFATISPGQINKNAHSHKKLNTASHQERTMRIRHYSLHLSLCAALPFTAVAAQDPPEGFIEGSTVNEIGRAHV